MYMFRMSAICVATIAVVLAVCWPGQARAQPASGIYILQYANAGTASADSGRYRVVVDTIQDRMLQLSTVIRGTGSQLTVFRRPDDIAGGLPQLQTRWRTSRALALMWGQIEGNGIVSSIYIGDNGQPDHALVRMARMSVSARNDRQIRDTHSLVAGYALLRDAVRRRAPRATIVAMVATLNNIGTGLRTSGFNNQQLSAILDDIGRIGRAATGR
jgi:hypothetical protein